jgi:hypothetical protein
MNLFCLREESPPDPQESVHCEPGDSGDLDVRDLHPSHPLAVPLRRRVVPRQICLQTGSNHARLAHIFLNLKPTDDFVNR